MIELDSYYPADSFPPLSLVGGSMRVVPLATSLLLFFSQPFSQQTAAPVTRDPQRLPLCKPPCAPMGGKVPSDSVATGTSQSSPAYFYDYFAKLGPAFRPTDRFLMSMTSDQRFILLLARLLLITVFTAHASADNKKDAFVSGVMSSSVQANKAKACFQFLSFHERGDFFKGLQIHQDAFRGRLR